MNHSSIQSRVNGLVIAIPANARGVLNRFHTPGDNELTFVGKGRSRAPSEDEAMKISTVGEDAERAEAEERVEIARRRGAAAIESTASTKREVSAEDFA